MSDPWPNSSRPLIDVAIVGGGCAGLYCAWRLARQEDYKPSTYVFEKGVKIGGRLLSVDLLPDGSPKAELGGMRFTRDHRLLRGLLEALKATGQDDGPLGTREFNFETKLMFLRGMHLRFNEDWHKQLLYKLDLDANCPLKWSAVEIARKAILTSINKIRSTNFDLSNHLEMLTQQLTGQSSHRLSARQWREFQKHAKVDGISIYHLGFWNLLQHCLSADEFLFLHDAMGYESLVANSNAAQSIPTFLADFDVDHYDTLNGGMDSIPRLLALRCRQENRNALIADHHEVEAIRFVQDGEASYFQLRVRCTPSELNSNISYVDHYKASKVILALPKDALQNLKLVGFPEDEGAVFRSNLNQVTAHPAFKLFLRYKEPWWQPELDFRARAITDLPIRQVYYLGEKEKPKNPGLVMASYSDEHYVDFWAPLIDDPNAVYEALKARERMLSKPPEASQYAASQRTRAKAEAQLRLMHPNLKIPESDFGVVKRWESAWHFWKAHSKPWETAGELVRPFGERDLFVCGEAYSLEQGWVEGALKSAERVLSALSVPPLHHHLDHQEYIEH